MPVTRFVARSPDTGTPWTLSLERMARAGAAVAFVALLVGGSAACGDDESSDLRQQVSELQTQLAQQGVEPTVTPTAMAAPTDAATSTLAPEPTATATTELPATPTRVTAATSAPATALPSPTPACLEGADRLNYSVDVDQLDKLAREATKLGRLVGFAGISPPPGTFCITQCHRDWLTNTIDFVQKLVNLGPVTGVSGKYVLPPSNC